MQVVLLLCMCSIFIKYV